MRKSTMSRTTKETNICITVNFDGKGKTTIDTGVGFFDHMLTALGMHAGWDLKVKVKGDLQVDSHHTIEDTGIVLGKAFHEALGEEPVTRYGNMSIPMDEALCSCALDISGRPYLVFNCDFIADRMGEMETQMVEEFFRAFAFQAGITMHLNCLYGKNDHHKTEALFKATAHALKQALVPRPELLSTKGDLDL